MINYELLVCSQLCRNNVKEAPCVSDPSTVICELRHVFLNNLGVCYGQFGKHAVAEIYFMRAHRIRDNQASFIYNIGISLFNQQLFSRAVEVFREYLMAEPFESRAWHLLGVALGQLERYDEALECLTRAADLYPGNSKMLHDVGICFFKMDQLKKARTMFEKVIANDPGFEKSVFYLLKCQEASYHSPE